MTHEYNLLQSIIILATFRKTFFGALMCTHFYVHHKDDDERKNSRNFESHSYVLYTGKCYWKWLWWCMKKLLIEHTHKKNQKIRQQIFFESRILYIIISHTALKFEFQLQKKKTNLGNFILQFLSHHDTYFKTHSNHLMCFQQQNQLLERRREEKCTKPVALLLQSQI